MLPWETHGDIFYRTIRVPRNASRCCGDRTAIAAARIRGFRERKIRGRRGGEYLHRDGCCGFAGAPVDSRDPPRKSGGARGGHRLLRAARSGRTRCAGRSFVGGREFAQAGNSATGPRNGAGIRRPRCKTRNSRERDNRNAARPSFCRERRIRAAIDDRGSDCLTRPRPGQDFDRRHSGTSRIAGRARAGGRRGRAHAAGAENSGWLQSEAARTV